MSFKNGTEFFFLKYTLCNCYSHFPLADKSHESYNFILQVWLGSVGF